MDTLVFEDDARENWRDKWVLDGLRASVRNTEKGMIYEAGPYPGDNGSMAVLWTKQSFGGDFRLDFDYTRLDSIDRFVNILYLQATGIGGEYPEDIHRWADKREIPYMRSYFNNMNLLHISFAAYSDDEGEYIRARRYPAETEHFGEKSEVGESLFNSGLFLPGVSYHISCIKTDAFLEFSVRGAGISPLIKRWDTSHLPPLAPGPLGIRHMCCRCSRYANIRVWQ